MKEVPIILKAAIDLSMDWFLYDRGLRDKRVKQNCRGTTDKFVGSDHPFSFMKQVKGTSTHWKVFI